MIKERVKESAEQRKWEISTPRAFRLEVILNINKMCSWTLSFSWPLRVIQSSPNSIMCWLLYYSINESFALSLLGTSPQLASNIELHIIIRLVWLSFVSFIYYLYLVDLSSLHYSINAIFRSIMLKTISRSCFDLF